MHRLVFSGNEMQIRDLLSLVPAGSMESRPAEQGREEGENDRTGPVLLMIYWRLNIPAG
jgi:hypothetical protein